MDKPKPKPAICGLAAGSLPAHHRGTRRKYVRVGSYAASMPRKVPRRWAGKDQSGWSLRMVQAMHDVRRLGNSASDQLPKASRVTERLSAKQPANCLVRCPRRLRDRVAAWMPPPSLHGGTCGVSRER
ncbi:hypothetical protein XHV734_1281 [Xanthomonas hortorum pv. vitians]|nr:hypothetical protein XHV734_1281 [Xanthomonas hortorum pv. vitians]